MSIPMETLRREEAAIFKMRALFGKYGYSRFKMSKFEEYDLYVRNKEFLVSDRMITFTDRRGVLLALKPDVTMSIIKTTKNAEKSTRKLYYNENVFRASKSDGDFREIMQTGLECIGSIDLYNICEVITLAVKSLQLIGEQYVLDISHLGFVSGLLSAAGVAQEEYTAVLRCVREKNAPELTDLCQRLGLTEDKKQLILKLITTYGPLGSMLGSLKAMCAGEEMENALVQLQAIYDRLEQGGIADNVRLDFSVVNDMSYYNGIVFQGFIQGAPDSVLSGGQYDRLMQKLGKDAGAIGFAVYLDELERLDGAGKDYDVDVLLLYKPDSDPGEVSRVAESIIAAGESVLPEKIVPEKLRYRRLVRLEEM
ncbi:MAG: ATP phosphoribosyltransferase regulatory subunit [Oscillospiraceae bacterium]|nr:ATP phosphoribosyltransferase regulatory subunit [Oscillospiraceae bacterium]